MTQKAQHATIGVLCASAVALWMDQLTYPIWPAAAAVFACSTLLWRQFATATCALEIIYTSENAEEAITDFQTVYSASGKTLEPCPELMANLIRLLASTRMMLLGAARLNGQAITAQLWIVSGNKAGIYNFACVDRFSAHLPGSVLTSNLMRHGIITDRVKEVNFLIGDDEHKIKWMDNRRERWSLFAYNQRSAVGLTLLCREAASRMVKAIRKKLFESGRA